MRIGLIATKIGMMSHYDEMGNVTPVTVLQISDSEVIEVKEREGQSFVTIGSNNKNAKKVSKPLRGYFSKHKVQPKSHVKEFKVSSNGIIESNTVLSAAHFAVGQYVDVRGKTIGKGFAGVMKRWNFGGLRASHGVSISHRSHGSTGMCQDPGKVIKGKKMAGHMGDKFRTMLNLRVINIDKDRGLIMLKGSVPGSNGSMVEIRDAIKKSLPAKAPMPTYIESKNIANEALQTNEVRNEG